VTETETETETETVTETVTETETENINVFVRLWVERLSTLLRTSLVLFCLGLVLFSLLKLSFCLRPRLGPTI
jgi:hypothetical protein